MKKLLVLATMVTLAGGAILSIIAGSWFLLAAAAIFMGGSIIISYIGEIMAVSGMEDNEQRPNTVCSHICTEKQ